MNDDAKFEIAVPLAMELGEGPVWHADQAALYWVDIKGFAVHRLVPATAAHTVVNFDEAITCVVPAADGGFIAACRSGLWQLNGQLTKTAHISAAPYETRRHRFNDGGCDPAGRFWIGAMNENVDKADADLYCYDGQALVSRIPAMTISNGLAFSPDGAWLYHTDTPTRVIRRHAFDAATGEIGPGEPWIDLNTTDLEGYPDGAAVDADGHYWSALFGGAAVARFDERGRLVARYSMAALNPTMPCFGGPDLKTLYVTTAREDMTAGDLARWPDSGALLAMAVDTPGLVKSLFRPLT